ncbi:MAG TPA: 50S ribosomal protein L29 [Acidimicrobiales bacterium]|nr:50S ribosomal protein L29 [Acidimicrobiales bacterium]
MATSDIVEIDDTTLAERLAEAREELFNLRFRHATGQLDNDRAIGAARRDVARILTELRRREIAEAESEESR